MRKLARIFAIVLLTAFAAGTVANAAGATSMSLQMSAIAMADGTMGDCQDCPSDNGKSLACDQACVAPLIAIAPVTRIDLPVAQTEVAVSPVKESAGHIGSPQPYPPRTIILS
ncbi:hypothetical protein [Mesorhizobium sp. A623]